MVGKALEAAERLAAEGIEVDVVDLRTLVPLDLETVEASVRKTGRLVVAAEAPRSCGVGAEVAAAIQEAIFNYLDAPVMRVGAPHAPIPHSPSLMEALVPSAADIVRAVHVSLDVWPSTNSPS
jgi:pyruvate dehydrogenase E1 component beta subunit